MGFLKPYSEQTYAAMRIVVGFLFFCHGVQKLLMGGAPPQMPAPLFWAAALIETGGGLPRDAGPARGPRARSSRAA